MFQPIFKKSLLTAGITVALDFTFHYFLTNPMETLTYFIIKFLLAFMIATALFSSKWYIMGVGKRLGAITSFGVIFSVLMSTYYRSWELFEALAPWGSRAPNIYGLIRGSFLFILAWGAGHALFFIVGALVAQKYIKDSE